MRKTVLVVASMFLVMLLASGVAWAAINCKAGNPCKGDDSRNVMFGFNGSDIMRGLGAADSMVGENGSDKMYGGPGSEGGGNAGYMFGGFGNDVMKGGKAPDAIYGEEDDDKLYGGPGPTSWKAPTEGTVSSATGATILSTPNSATGPKTT